jgi:hypothetical protein
MTRFISSLVAAVALAVASLGSVAAVDYGPECFTPEMPEGYICRFVSVTLVPDADIEAVLARTVGDVDHLENVGDIIRAQGEEPVDESADRMWNILLAEGGDALEAIDLLVADPDVETATWSGYGMLTGPAEGSSPVGALPDTAVAVTGLPLVSAIGALLVVVGGGTALRRRLA